jgi:hypothetical protein
VGEDGGYGRRGYAVVLEVDEAGGLEAFEDCGGGLLLCGRVAREEGGEVDELCDVSVGRGFSNSVSTGISKSSCETAEATVMFAMPLALCRVPTTTCLRFRGGEGERSIRKVVTRIKVWQKVYNYIRRSMRSGRPTPLQLVHHEMVRGVGGVVAKDGRCRRVR